MASFSRKQGNWTYDEKHTISLTSLGDDEIQILLDFLLAVKGATIPSETSEYLVVPAPVSRSERDAIADFLANVSVAGKAEVLTDLLQRVSGDAAFFGTILERASRHPKLFAEAAAALNLATYRAAIEELTALVNSEERVRESQFQQLLAENPWMFGSEYSEVLDRRRWTRDEEQDFVVRRPSDSYIELIEIKTPLGGVKLFNYDASHKSHYPGVELSKVVGQVENYIEELDANRHTILAKDGEDTCKIRGKVIIGRDGDKDQQMALRRFNGHLHRMEVLTFDQLLRIAERVVSYLESALRPAQHTEDDDREADLVR